MLRRNMEHVKPQEEADMEKGVISYSQRYNQDVGKGPKRSVKFTSTSTSTDGVIDILERDHQQFGHFDYFVRN